MKKLKANEIREMFIEFFETKQHKKLKSFPLVPNNDKSLLLINAGMAPMKNYFLGIEEPPSKRVTTSQKCIRTGDIENVGKTARHGTFFEMLGNFSFEDYFKKEAIQWTWEFTTEVLKLPKDKIFVTVYTTDDEAYEIWNKDIGVPKEKISRLEEDNFWEIGVGPCGPCTELYYDRGIEYSCGLDTCTVGCDCDRYLEFWNLVFIQFAKDKDGVMTPLKKPSVDTGMGLERISSIMQNVNTIFDIDSSQSIVNEICSIANYKYGSDKEKDISIRIITDHIKSGTFLVGDGVVPSNEGRGYVLRKLLRRSIVHGKKIGITKPFTEKVVSAVINNYKYAYEELEEKFFYINKVIATEEKRFYETIEQGIKILNEYKIEAEVSKILDGKSVFKLYDTYGFPIEIMEELLEDDNIKLDIEGFKKEMNIQKERARSARKETTYTGKEKNAFDNVKDIKSTKFVGYEKTTLSKANILVINKENEIVASCVEGDEVSIIFDKTPFYAESGGQAGDCGTIKNKECELKILDCVKFGGDKFVHICKVIKGELKKDDLLDLKVEEDSRHKVTRNHTATHILHKALKEILGEHVEQAGVSVTKDRIRFDFNHLEGMTKKEIEDVETKVNNIILKGLCINTVEENIDKAKKRGVISLFGEKYSEIVRVVSIGDYSLELCGGTHLKNTSTIGSFKILSETGVSAGVRRIEAVTGEKVLEHNKEIENTLINILKSLKADKYNAENKIKSLVDNNKELQKQIKSLKSNNANGQVDQLIKEAIEINGLKVIIKILDDENPQQLKELGDKIKDKEKSIGIIFLSENSDRVNIICMLTEDLVKKGLNAGNIIKDLTSIVNGRGGGRPNMAQGGGNAIDKKEDAFKKALEIIKI